MTLPIPEELQRELAYRIFYARTKHPEGADLAALWSEHQEVLEAYIDGDEKHMRYELLDLITVALRILMGEVPQQKEDSNHATES